MLFSRQNEKNKLLFEVLQEGERFYAFIQYKNLEIYLSEHFFDILRRKM